MWKREKRLEPGVTMLELTHAVFALVQILQRVSLSKPRNPNVDTRWGKGGVRAFIVDQPAQVEVV